MVHLTVLTSLIIAAFCPTAMAAEYAPDPFRETRALKRDESQSQYFWYNKDALDSMQGKYAPMAQARDQRRMHHQNTLQQEEGYIRESGQMVSAYMRQTLRMQLRRASKDLRQAIVGDVRTNRREGRAAGERVSPMKITRVESVGNAPSHPARKVVASAQMQAPVSENADVAEATGEDNDYQVEQAFKSLWNVGHNIIEDHQSIAIADDTEARMHFDLPRATMHVDFVSPIVNADAQRRVVRSAMPLSGAGAIQGDATTVGITRDFKEITLGTGVRYGVESGTVNYTVSKQLVGPMSAGFTQTQALTSGQNNSTVQLSVGLGI
jgi:hypothetical protein